MDQHQQQLIAYIGNQLQSGASIETITQNLLQSGWDAARIQQAMQSLGVNFPPQGMPEVTLQAPNYGQPAQGMAGYPSAGHQGMYPGQPMQQQYGAVPGGMPQKYRVFQSIADSFRAIQNNLSAYLVAALGSLIISTAATIGLAIVSGIIVTSLVMSFFTTNPIAAILVVFVVLTVISSVTYTISSAFMTAAIAYPLMSGADHKKDRAADVLRHAILRVPKVILANMAVTVIIFIPFFVMLILLIIFGFSVGRSSSGGLLIIGLTPLLYLGGLAWSIIAIFRYALTPYVVIFEENLTIRQALRRSKFLLVHGGQWFLFKGILLTGAVIILTAMATGSKLSGTQQRTSVLFDIASCLIVTMVINSMVMLYRNRRMVRGTQP